MYDVACVFQRHVTNLSGSLGTLKKQFKFAVPAFHSYAHNMNCQLSFGKQYTDQSRMVDGECVERLWSYLRKFSSSTKEMNLVNRTDLLTDGLLHYAEHSHDNLVYYLQVRFKRAKAAQIKAASCIEAAEKKYSGTAAQWLKDWKSCACQNTSIQGFLSNEQEYCLTLLQEHEEKLKSQLCQEYQEKDLHGKRAQSLNKRAQELKEILCLSLPWSIECREVAEKADAARYHLKKSLLTKGHKLATERHYLLSQCRKYSDGQTLASRLLRKLKANGAKCADIFERLKSECRIDATMADLMDICSSLYSDFRPLNKVQLEAAQAVATKERAEEEERALFREIKSLFSFFKRKTEFLKVLIHRNFENLTNSQVRIHLITKALYDTEEHLQTLSKNFPEFLDTGYDLVCHDSVCLPFQSELLVDTDVETDFIEVEQVSDFFDSDDDSEDCMD